MADDKKKRPKPREDRGEFRGIYETLPDSPEFRALTPIARACFYPLKLKLGRAGIAVFYLEALPRLTGFTYQECTDAVAELVATRWLIIDHDLVWIRNGLRFDPFDPLANDNGKIGIVRHLRTLPKSPLIETFVAYYKLEKQWRDEARKAGVTVESGHRVTEGVRKEVGEGVPHEVGGGRTQPRNTEDVARNTEHGTRRDTSHTPTDPITREDSDQSGDVPDSPPPHADSNGGRSVEGMDNEQFVSHVITLANRGMIDGAIGNSQRFRPIETNGRYRQTVFDWIEQGYSRQTIASAVYYTAKAFQPTEGDRQISSMRYFDDAVKRTHETGKATKVEIPPDSEAGRLATRYTKPDGTVDETPYYQPHDLANRTGRPVRADGHDPEAERLAAEAAEDAEIERWELYNPDLADSIRDDVAREMSLDPALKNAPEVAIRVAGRSKVKKRIWEFIQQQQQPDATPSERRSA